MVKIANSISVVHFTLNIFLLKKMYEHNLISLLYNSKDFLEFQKSFSFISVANHDAALIKLQQTTTKTIVLRRPCISIWLIVAFGTRFNKQQKQTKLIAPGKNRGQWIDICSVRLKPPPSALLHPSHPHFLSYLTFYDLLLKCCWNMHKYCRPTTPEAKIICYKSKIISYIQITIIWCLYTYWQTYILVHTYVCTLHM